METPATAAAASAEPFRKLRRLMRCSSFAFSSSLMGGLYRQRRFDPAQELARARQVRMDAQECLCNFVGFEQQILAFVSLGRVCIHPEVALSALEVAVRETHEREAAPLPTIS